MKTILYRRLPTNAGPAPALTGEMQRLDGGLRLLEAILRCCLGRSVLARACSAFLVLVWIATGSTLAGKPLVAPSPASPAEPLGWGPGSSDGAPLAFDPAEARRLNQPGATAKIVLPDGRQATLRVETVHPLGDDRCIADGSLVEQAEARFQIAVNPQGLAGTLALGGQAYSLESDGSLVPVEALLAGHGFCRTSATVPREPVTQGALHQAAPAQSAAVPSGAAEQLDLLVLYTDPVLKAAGGRAGVDALIDYAVHEANTAYTNSKVNVRLKPVGRVRVPYVESGRIITDVAALPGIASSLRTTYRADLVILMVERSDEGYWGVANGIPTRNGDSSTAYAVFLRRVVTGGTRLVAHEIGHLMGCAHDRATTPSSGLAFSYSRGHRFVAEGATFATIMSYEPGFLIPHFSNPEVLFRGVPTGVPAGKPGEADNARTINLLAPLMAKYQRVTNRVEFARANFTASRQEANAVMELIRAGDLATEASVTLSAANGTAINGVDFTFTDTVVNFAPGETVRTVNLALLSDEARAGDRALQLNLAKPNLGTGLGWESTATLVLEDRRTGYVAFDVASVAIPESDAQPVHIPLLRRGDLSLPLSISVEARSGTADATDFELLTPSVQFAAGVERAFVDVRASADNEAEPDEVFTLMLNGGAGASPLASSSVEVAVRDDDRVGAVIPAPSGAGFPDATVVAAVRRDDGRIVVGGWFPDAAGDFAIPGVRQFLADGSPDPAFAPASITTADLPLGYGGVMFLTLDRAGRALVTGSFMAVNGVARNGIARLHADGSLDTTFDLRGGPNSFVSGVAFQADDRLLVCGTFSEFAGEQRTLLARLETDGRLDPTFKPVFGPNGANLDAVAVQPDGRILVGGFYETLNDRSRPRIAQLLPDGTSDLTFRGNANGSVQGLEVLPDGGYLARGVFRSPKPLLARLRPNGATDTAFTPAAVDTALKDMLPLPDGRVVIAGDFTRVGTVPRVALAMLDASGAVESTFDANLGPGSVVHRLVPDGADGLYLFGWLRATAASPWSSALRIRLGPLPPRVLPPVADATVGWRIPVFGLRNTRHVLERSPDLTAWTAVSTNHFIGSAGEFIQPTGSQTEFYRVRQAAQ